jgi:hypothetical protein
MPEAILMKKKIFRSAVATLLIILASVHLAEAQQPVKVLRMGVIRTGSSPDIFVEMFRQALRDLGYVDGQNIAIQ